MVQNDSPDAVIFTCGEPSFQDCLAAVKNQTLPPGRIHVVENVYPQGLASKLGHEEILRQGSRTYVSVDADMILHPNCFETLSARLEADVDTCFAVAARLEDGIEGPVFGVKIFRTRMVADLGGFREVVGVFREIDERARHRGWKSLFIDQVMGLHNPAYTPERAFIRFWTKSIRLKEIYGLTEKTFRLWHNHLKILLMHYADQGRDLPAIAALAGLFCGILADGGALEDHGEVTRSQGYQAYMRFFDHHADPPLNNRGRAARSPRQVFFLPDLQDIQNAVDAPDPAFIRPYIETGRLKEVYGYSEETFRLWVERFNGLIMNYVQDQSLPAIASFAGHFCGMLAEAAPETPEEAARSVEFLKFGEFFSHYADPVRNEALDASG